MNRTPDRERKIAEARRLHAEGLNRVEIGKRLGVTGSCVGKWLNPERARAYNRKQEARPERIAAKRKWDREHYMKPCKAGCGKEVWKHPRNSGYCPTCHPFHAARHERRHRRAEQIVRWWSEGLTHAQMAERLGRSKDYVQVEVVRLRQLGYDLPCRPKGRFKHHREASETTSTTSETTDLAA